MEIDHHRQRQAQLHHGRSDHDFKHKKNYACGRDHRIAANPLRQPQRQAKCFRQQTQLDAELRDARVEVQIAVGVFQIAQPAFERPGSGADQRHGKRRQKTHGQERKLKAGVEE